MAEEKQKYVEPLFLRLFVTIATALMTLVAIVLLFCIPPGGVFVFIAIVMVLAVIYTWSAVVPFWRKR